MVPHDGKNNLKYLQDIDTYEYAISKRTSYYIMILNFKL
jgi:hypothetical protein